MKFDIKDYIGARFGNVIVIGKDSGNSHKNSNHWVFRCDCGTIFSSLPSRIISGHSKSCGCKKSTGAWSHGCNGNEFYPTWWAMMRRCYNQGAHNYKRYGGRGIRVCQEWHNPKNFIDWAESTVVHKSKGLTLERKDNNKEYSPENCCWATPKQQARNRRSNRILSIDGVEKSLSEWCEYYKIDPSVVRERIKLGWPEKDALSIPVQSRHWRYPYKKDSASIE
jgi:hypothetical protein